MTFYLIRSPKSGFCGPKSPKTPPKSPSFTTASLSDQSSPAPDEKKVSKKDSLVRFNLGCKDWFSSLFLDIIKHNKNESVEFYENGEIITLSKILAFMV